MSVTVEMLTGHRVTVSEHDGDLQWECDKCGRCTPDDWCFHMCAVVCKDAAAVRPNQVGYLNKAHQIIARHREIVQVLTARLTEATKHGNRLREVQQLEAAIASLTSHQ